LDGEKYIISHPKPGKELKPIKEYLELQRRFGKLSEEQIALIQERVLHEWERLLKKAA
jgi:pyruvate ferredoxin oxidoreductase beta subunit